MAELTKVDSFQYPNGHLGHLSDNQQRALDDFKVLCEKEGYYTTKAEGGKPASHDDETLLRYLRARKFVPKEALTQFKATEDWRKENKLEELYDTIDITEYDETRRLYPQWTGRRDRRGIPVYVFEVAPLNSKALNAYEKSVTKKPTVTHNETKVSSKMLRLFALYENLTRFVLPLCTAIKDRPHPETPISQSNNIVDISNVGLKQFWNLKSHMQDASQLATAYYPETLDRIFIIGAPSFFPTVWSWVKRWFDPITVSKIFILSAADMKPTLEKYIAIENIPKKYGGTLEYEFGMLPMLEEEISNNLKWTNPSADMQSGKKSYPTGPIKWRASSATMMEAIAVGSENGKRREEAIATVETSFDDIHGISRVNTTIDWSLEKVRSTSGTATQPADDGDPNYGSELRDPSLDEPNAVAAGAVQANNTTTLPARPLDTGNNDLPPSNTQPRTGTSDTRLEQQDATHAAGTVASGTPHTINYGQHDKASTMEPATVGQAPKDVSANLATSANPEAPGYLAQAQTMASQVVASAAGAVGLGSTTGDKEKVGEGVEQAQKDKRVDGVKDEVVEEYLRTKVPSTDPTAQGKA